MSDASAAGPVSHPTVYVETSVISYLAARASGDPVTRGHQEVTRRWWANRSRWNLVVSSAVMIESLKGDHDTAVRRISLLEGIPTLVVDGRAKAFALGLLRRGALQSNARMDADHIAVAAVNGVDYLLTWNLKHIANPATRRVLEELCRSAGFEPPLICTPKSLMESSHAR